MPFVVCTLVEGEPFVDCDGRIIVHRPLHVSPSCMTTEMFPDFTPVENFPFSTGNGI
jgi:hypothetical protein